MSDYLSDLFTECRRAEARLRDTFGNDLSEDMLLSLIPKVIRILREDDAERLQMQSSQGRDLKP